MIPKKLSPTTKSNAEKTLFQIFEKNLSDDYVVFHGVWWQDIKYIVQDREADFIIIHPDRGILILEPKGGLIAYAHLNMAWYQNQYKMKISPFKQAKEIKYKFLDFLSKHNEFKNKDFCIGQCVGFPDMDGVVNNLPSEAPQEILLLRPQLGNISGWISSVFDYYYKAEKVFIKLGEQRTNSIINLISPSTVFKKYIVNDIGENNQEILQLTEKQFDILNNLYQHPQCIVLGCAGSGKTELAIEKARRLCQHLVKTLVICKSNNLSLYLAASLQDEIKRGYCVVYSFEEIHPRKSQLTFDFTAIILDEGQDFESEEINDLKQLIPPDDGIFYIFQDSNQRISKNANKFALQVHQTFLQENCRNTHKIFKYAEPFVSCSHAIESSLMEGRDVVSRVYEDTDDIFIFLEKYLTNLVNNHNVLPNQIVILTDMYLSSKSILSQYSHIDRFDLKPYSFNKDKNTIQWSNIGMYKGLESDVIMLFLEKEKKLIPSNWDIADRYVGATRAKSFLVVYEPPDRDIDF